MATFSSVRSANRSAKTSERMLEAGLRPVLFPSRPEDPAQKVMWGDRHFTRLPGGRAMVEEAGDQIYMSISLRNVGSGIAVIHGWYPWGEWRSGQNDTVPVDQFRRQSRDLYVPPGDVFFWQGAIREADDPHRTAIEKALAAGEGVTIDLLYSDHEGGQRTITRFGLTPISNGEWFPGVSRHWNIDRPDPR